VTLIVTLAADGDILEAATWYDRQARTVRENFLNAVYATLDVIEQRPLQYQTIRGRVRRVMIRGFPYALLYIIDDETVRVVACFHTSRDPKRWQNRTRE
jgi:plasmid stabilization system protein ParE